ncbi:SusC/RagA family TonB-linked outer membrane protein [Puteibacter caeruleilacunae]|nr:SusC/RagA family TonB-linked outer membrane protein [Puteibacter caeruleilacunae]
MKKNSGCRGWDSYALKKTLRIMRIGMIIFLLSMFQLQAVESFSQEKLMSIKLKDVTVEDVLEKLESETEYRFFYNSRVVDIKRRVNVNATNRNINDVLEMLFGDTQIKYMIIDQQVLLSSKAIEKTSSQQAKVITGTVTDENGEGLPGVSVVVKGTTIGITTDVDGKYSLDVPASGEVLLFSFVGMKTKEVVISGQKVINISLEEDAIGLEEVIAVGYQSKHKTNLTGSVATVSSEQLKDRPTAKLTSVLPGMAPGLTVTRSNPGRIGQTSESLRIGGITSRSNPGILVVIDGVPQEGTTSALNSINPNDVESISVLKDAEAVIYGARASGGVLVITTKKGGKPNLSASASVSFRKPHIYPRKTNMLQMFEMLEEGWENNGITPMWGFPKVFKYVKDNNITFDDIKNNDFQYAITDGAQFPDTPYLGFGHTDWIDTMYGTGVSKNYDVSASGSSKKTNYYLSLGIVDEGSMLRYGRNNSYTYYTRLKYEYQYNEMIKVGANIGLRYQRLTEPTAYGTVQSLAASKHTYDHPYTPEGKYMNWGGFQNPIGWAEEGGDHRIKFYDVKPQLFVEVTPISGLKIKANFAKNVSFRNGRSLSTSFKHYYGTERFSFENRRQSETSVGSQLIINNSFTGNLQATYNVQIQENHKLRALAGMSHEEFTRDVTTSWRDNLAYDKLQTLNLGDSEKQYNSDEQTQDAIKSYFGNISYSYADKYVVEASVRRDGSSRFAKGYKWDEFFGGGVAWNVDKEGFFQNLNLHNVNALKLRSSWGQLGNIGSIGLYDFVSQINIGQSNLLLGQPTSVAKLQTATLAGFPSLTRTWEVAEKLNFGYDLTMFDGRFKSSFNYFITNTDNMFYGEEFPSVLGTAPPSINGAHVRTNGWDLSLEWNDKIGSSFTYYGRFGISDANTEVKSLSDSRIIKYGNNAFVEGYSVGSMFGYDYDGLIQDDADLADYLDRIEAGITRRVRVGDAKYKDLDGDGKLEGAKFEAGEDGNPTADSGDLVYLGDTEIHYNYYFDLGFSWKGFDFSMLLNGVGKWNVWERTGTETGYPWVQPLEHFYNNTWSADRPDAKYPRLSVIGNDFSNDRNDNNYRISNAPYVKQNVPYLAIKNIKLGYNIPKSIARKLRTERLYVYANISDLGYIINKMPKSYSPEQPFNSNITPYPQTFSFGLNVNF